MHLNPNQNRRPLAFAVLLMGSFAQAQVTPPPAPSSGSDTAEETVVLSPFVVNADSTMGYVANSTLAGTRLNTALRDIGASISIVTQEFMADTASTSITELLSLTTGTEVGGVYGNFAGGSQSGSRADQSESRENAQDNQRIRGIGAAANTRDFFLTDIPFDSYNTSRVTINRGPNSLLFGIGNPAGVIDASLSKAQLSRNRSEVAVRIGSNSSHRATLDVNRVLVKDRLAVRLAAVSERNDFDQEPATDRKRRLYGTLEGVIRDGKRGGWLGRTSLRATGEIGDSDSIPINVIPPTDSYSVFYTAPDPAIDNLPGINLHPTLAQGGPGFIWAPGVTVDNRLSSTAIPQNNGFYYAVPYFIQIPLVFDASGQTEPGYRNSNSPALADLSGIMGRIRYTQAGNGRPAIDAISTTSLVGQLPGFVAQTVRDRSVFDYRKRLISGESNNVEQNFHTASFVLTQELFDQKGGFELAFDKQLIESSRILPFSYGQNGANIGAADIRIDVSRYLSNDVPNPNLGRPFIVQLGLDHRIQERERESGRATAFYRLDLEDQGRRILGIPLGNHTLTGLHSTQRFDVRSEGYQLGWESDTRNLNTTVFQDGLGGFRRTPVLIQYVGPSVIGAGGTLNPLRATDSFSGRLPANGDRHTVTFYDSVARQLVTEELWVRRFLNGGSLGRQQIDSQSLSLKSDFFANNIVSIVGWRWDQLETFANENNSRLPDGTLNPDFVLSQSPNLDESSKSFTWSIVGRYPDLKCLPKLPGDIELSAYINKSGNFNPVAIRSNLKGEIIPAPEGETEEYGFLVEFLQRRASLRLNWFRTTQANSSNNAQGATSEIFNFPSFLLTRYRSAETAGIAFASIPGVTAAGYNSYDQLYGALFDLLPEPTNTLKNLRFENGTLRSDGIQGLTDTSNLVAKGFEAELVGQITRNLRISANIAQQNTIIDGSARLTKEVADAVFANMERLNLLRIDNAPDLPERLTAAQRFTLNVGSRLGATIARDGAAAQEQREWRANFVGTYDLKDIDLPVLKNMSVGTAIRWQSKVAIGNPFLTGERLKAKIVETNPNFTNTSQIADTDAVMQTQFPDLENPFFGPEELAGDVWISYRKKLNQKIDWRLQLNVRNAWGNSDDIPVAANPDGSIAVVRIPNETRWFLTNTFSF